MLKRFYRNEQGSIMLETALIMPIFLVIILGIIQIAYLLTAQQMTRYAAYCSARAALVYHPQDEANRAQEAAAIALSWISFSFGGENPVNLDGHDVPLSDDIRSRVHVTVADDLTSYGKNVETPCVTATVTFDFNLFIPVANIIVGALFVTPDIPDYLVPGADSGSIAGSHTAAQLDKYYKRPGVYQVPLTASCTLPKPYTTNTFPRRGAQ